MFVPLRWIPTLLVIGAFIPNEDVPLGGRIALGIIGAIMVMVQLARSPQGREVWAASDPSNRCPVHDHACASTCEHRRQRVIQDAQVAKAMEQITGGTLERLVKMGSLEASLDEARRGDNLLEKAWAGAALTEGEERFLERLMERRTNRAPGPTDWLRQEMREAHQRVHGV